jgi:flagellar hook-associated protein 2
MDGLETNVSTLQGQATEIGTLQSDFTAIQSAIQTLSTGGASSLAATVADSSIASATVDTTQQVTAGSYTLNVISTGSQTTTLSNNGLLTVSDPSTSSISTSSSFTLTVGGSNYTITPTSNTLDALAQSINSSGAGVSATLVNIGSPSSPDYRLSLQSTTLGDTSIQLNDGTQNLLETLTTGAPAQYQVDGQPSTPISSNTDTVTLAPGVTADLLGTGQTTVTVAPDSSAAATALSTFVSAYNSAATELGNNRGTAGGALTGQSLVYELEQSLESMANYSGGSGSVQNLAALGLTFNSTGQLTFDQTTFQSIEASDPSDVATFLGSATGGGFLTNATNILNGLEAPTTGIFAAATNTVQGQITSDNNQITADQQSITTMQNTMTEQMSKADAAIASLESQLSYYTSLFTDEQQNSTSNG